MRDTVLVVEAILTTTRSPSGALYVELTPVVILLFFLVLLAIAFGRN